MLLALLEKVILGFLIQRFLDGRWTICHREIGPVRAFQLCTKRAVSSELEGSGSGLYLDPKRYFEGLHFICDLIEYSTL
jgi:hypothetical protein